MQDSIFTKIIKGEIPCHKIYEDEKTFAFLDIHPVADGHTLVVSKKQVEFLWDLDGDDYDAVMKTAKKVALRAREVFQVPYIGERVIGTDVPHVHVHIIPFSDPHVMYEAADMQAEPDHERLAEIARKLVF